MQSSYTPPLHAPPVAAVATASPGQRVIFLPGNGLLHGGVHAAAAQREPRGRMALEVIGAILMLEFVSRLVVSIVGGLFRGGGWAPAIGAESIYLITCLLCLPLLPSGIRHVVNLKTTLDGLWLDWPEMLYATWVLWTVLQYGLPNGIVAPLMMALAVGAAEEFVFRVLFLGWLVTRMDAAPALLISSIVFGLAHLHEYSLLGVLSIVPQFAGGMILGAVYLRTRNPLGGIIAHAYWDLPYMLLLGYGISGGGTEAGIPSVLSLVPWMAAGVYGLWLVRPGVDCAGREHSPTVHVTEATARS